MKRVFAAITVTLFGVLLMSFSNATACECEGEGTGTPGYWMNHPEAWPYDEIEVGGQIYTKDVAIILMQSPVKGDKSLTMFAAFIAAKLNVLTGNCPPTCYSLDEVNTWLANFPVGSGVRANSEAWQYSHGEALYWCLDEYNNGLQEDRPSRDSLE